MQQAEKKQRRWKICLDAKAKKFVFKLKATIPFSPDFNVFPPIFSFILLINNYNIIRPSSHLILKVKSSTTSSSKFFGIFRKLRIGPSKNKPIVAFKSTSNIRPWSVHEGLICVGSVVFGSVADVLYKKKKDKMEIVQVVMQICFVIMLLLICFYYFGLKMMKNNLVGRKKLGDSSRKVIKIVVAVVNVVLIGGIIYCGSSQLLL